MPNLETILVIAGITSVGVILNVVFSNKFLMSAVFIGAAVLLTIASAFIGGWTALGLLIFAIVFFWAAVATQIISLFLPIDKE
jgi:hypothetical protein